MKKVIVVISFLGLILSSCNKDLDNAAINRNNPENVDIAELFPSAQQHIAYTIGNSFAIYGGVWAQYWTQGSTARQYLDNEKYIVTNANQNRPWSQLYSGALTDLKFIKTKALAEKDSQIYGMALVMEAYTYQVLADAYEKVPMREALNPDNFAPAYDEPTVVYDAIEAKLVEAKTLLAAANAGGHPKTYSFDLFYGGNIASWIKFTNTLLLKVYMRQSYARPNVAQAGIATNLAGASFLSTTAEMAMARYGTTLTQKNPLHASQLQLANFENLKASNTSLNVLNADLDKRIGALYNKNAGGTYVGFNQGAGQLPTASTANTNFSNIGDKIGGKDGAAAPVIFMSNWESFFLQAEAAARGWLGGSASTLYSNGIRESHIYLGFTAADATTVAALHPLSGSAENQVGLIIAQKWVSMNGTQCFEGYNEVRRMNYSLPYVIFPVSAVSVFGPGFMPHRFPYSDDEISSNPSTPASKIVHQKMWFSK
jgi:hypothetical protein